MRALDGPTNKGAEIAIAVDYVGVTLLGRAPDDVATELARHVPTGWTRTGGKGTRSGM